MQGVEQRSEPTRGAPVTGTPELCGPTFPPIPLERMAGALAEVQSASTGQTGGRAGPRASRGGLGCLGNRGFPKPPRGLPEEAAGCSLPVTQQREDIRKSIYCTNSSLGSRLYSPQNSRPRVEWAVSLSPGGDGPLVEGLGGLSDISRSKEPTLCGDGSKFHSSSATCSV